MSTPLSCAAVGEAAAAAAGQSSGLIDRDALLSLLHKSDGQTPSLPSLHLNSRLAPQSTTTVTSSPAPVHGLLFAFTSTSAGDAMLVSQFLSACLSYVE